MKDVQETLLYIAHNLANQNQTISIDALRKPLELMDCREFDLEKELAWLVSNEFLVRNSANELLLTEKGKRESSRINKIRGKDDFNRLISRSVDSAAYLDYCEEIYGYRMHLFNMMDKHQLDYLFKAVAISERDTVLDIGCGTGGILNHLVKKYACSGIGVDQLDEATVRKSSELISYIDGDIDKLSAYSFEPNITLSIDSLYFVSDLDGLIKLLKNITNNRLYFFYSQYIFEESTRDKSVLDHDNTRIAGILQKNELQYRTIDYSANEHFLYENSLKVLPKYKTAFETEGNSDLYEHKLRECRSGKELYDKGLASRYLYILE